MTQKISEAVLVNGHSGSGVSTDSRVVVEAACYLEHS